MFSYWFGIAALFVTIFAAISQTDAFKYKSLNTVIRKLFHALALLLFLPPLVTSPKLLRFSMSIAAIILIFLEYLRFFCCNLIALEDISFVASKQREIGLFLSRAVAPVTNARDRRGPLTLCHVRLFIPYPQSQYPSQPKLRFLNRSIFSLDVLSLFSLRFPKPRIHISYTSVGCQFWGLEIPWLLLWALVAADSNGCLSFRVRPLKEL